MSAINEYDTMLIWYDVQGICSNFKIVTYLFPIAGVNFINVLQVAFMHADPKSAKRQSGVF